MPQPMEKLLLAFIPLFVAIDPIGVVPLFLGISQGIAADRKRRIVNQATWTAAIVAIGFMFLGKLIFRVLNITVADFQVAGGIGYALAVLLINLALINLCFRNRDRIARVLGMPGLRAFSKITSLLFAAIAVAMIRRGWHTM